MPSQDKVSGICLTASASNVWADYAQITLFFTNIDAFYKNMNSTYMYAYGVKNIFSFKL